MQLICIYGKSKGLIIGNPTDETPLIFCYYSLEAKNQFKVLKKSYHSDKL